MPQHLLTPEAGGSLTQEMAASLTRLRELRGRLTSASVCSDFAFSLPEVGEASLPEGVTVGSAVLAPGLHAGQKKPFRAVLLGVRNIFPPLLVRYVATLDGRTIPLLLPEIRSTYLPSSDVSKFDEVAGVRVSVSFFLRARARARDRVSKFDEAAIMAGSPNPNPNPDPNHSRVTMVAGSPGPSSSPSRSPAP
jgi:hypothetical protein